MSGLNKYLAATFLLAAMLFTRAAQAVDIKDYFKMADQDQSDYIQVLVDGAEKILRDEGRDDLATKMDKLFTEIPPGDKISVGMTEFERNLARLRVDDAENAQKNPKDPRLEVEDAMFVTLQKNHIDLPDSFFTVASNFHPKFPPQSKDKKEKKD